MTERVFITGANRGLGLEFVRQYLNSGWKVYATARQPENADELHSLQDKFEKNLKILRLDISKEDSVEAVGRTMERLEDGIELLINNAGTYGSKDGFLELEPEQLTEIFAVNCVGSFRLTQRLFSLVRGVKGDVVFITSLMGSIDDNRSGGAYPYRISKAALNMLGKTVSEDFKSEGVYTLLLHPGWVKTRMGGENAKINVETSVTGMREVISQMDLEMSGKFYAYDGETRPW